jgi:copper resistance protein C
MRTTRNRWSAGSLEGHPGGSRGPSFRGTGLGQVAPSSRRFTLPSVRRDRPRLSPGWSQAAAAFVTALALVASASAALAHAFLDHASPAVGSSVPAAPAAVAIWYTQDLEPAFSAVIVTNAAGQRVDLGNAHVAPGGPNQLQVGLKPLPPGTYTVTWHVVSVDTHPTQGTFTFDVGGR